MLLNKFILRNLCLDSLKVHELILLKLKFDVQSYKTRTVLHQQRKKKIQNVFGRMGICIKTHNCPSVTSLPLFQLQRPVLMVDLNSTLHFNNSNLSQAK